MESDNPSQPNAGNEPASTSGPSVFGPTPAGSEPAPTPTVSTPPTQQPVSGSELQKSKKKKLSLPVVIALAAILLLSGSAAAYFGYILPNKPENVWEKALTNTARGYDGLVNYAEETKDIKGFKAKGKLKLEGVVAGDGNIEMHGDEKNATIKADIGFAGSRYNIDALLNTPDGSETPDLYFKVGGIKGVGDLFAGSPYEDFGPLINQLDSQWIFVDHTLFDQMASSAGAGNQPTLTEDDMLAIARAVGEVNREYLFSTDPGKRVFTVAKQVGKEERDGRSVYHYEVGYNKDNLKKYVTALKDRLKDTKVKDLLEASGQSYDEAFDIEDTLREIDRLKGDETADVWVDMRTKLIRYVRFSDENNKDNYVEIGVPYNGGDEVPFTLLFNVAEEDPGKVELSLTVNTETHISVLKLDSSFESGGQKQTITGDLTFEPSDQTVEFTKPDSARPIMEIIGAFYGGMLGGTSQLEGPNFANDLPLDEIEL